MSFSLNEDEQFGLPALSEKMPIETVFDEFATDGELLAIFVETRSNAAAELLVRRHGPMVAGVIRRLLHQSSDAEDAFQATFLILLQSASKIQKQASLPAWLYGVAYRTACRVRQRSKQRRVVAMNEALIEPIQIDSPLEKIASESQLELLDRELDRLKPLLKETLIEHHLLGFTAPQIAERLNISVSAVEGRLRRGRSLLRQRLARRGISFSVAFAIATAYQQNCVAAIAKSWTCELLQSELFSQNIVANTLPSTDSSLLPLIQGELAMKSVLVKGASFVIAVSCLAAVGTFPFFSFSNGQTANRVFSIAATTHAADSVSPTANFNSENDAGSSNGSSVDQSPSNDPFGEPSRSNVVPSNPFVDDTPATTRITPKQSVLALTTASDTGEAKVVGMGGGPANDSSKNSSAPVKVVPFKKPSGELPKWLIDGGTAAQEEAAVNEAIRSVLRTKIRPDFSNTPLRAVIEAWSAEKQIPILIDTVALEGAGGATADDPVTLTGIPEISMRSAMRLVLDPLELTYVIEDEVMKITTKDQGSARIRRMYDLAHLLPSDERAGELIRVIQGTVNANWDVDGLGEDTLLMFGSILVASCPEETQIEIEGLLFELSKLSQENF